MQDQPGFSTDDRIPVIRQKAFLMLSEVYEKGEAEAIVKLLLQAVMDKPYHIALAENVLLSKGSLDRFEHYLEQARQGVPWQYIIGKSDFCGLEFLVNPDVLIPRPETEELVKLVLEDIKGKDKSHEAISLLDAGTGSACIAVALASKLSNADVWAVDVSEKAMSTAKINAKRNKVEIRFLLADLLEAPPQEIPKLDIIVSNPPYVLEEEREAMHINVLENEPASALFVPNDKPLLFYKAVIHWAERRLKRGGALYFEINERYGKALHDLLREKGFIEVSLFQDFRGKDRIIRAVYA